MFVENTTDMSSNVHMEEITQYRSPIIIKIASPSANGKVDAEQPDDVSLLAHNILSNETARQDVKNYECHICKKKFTLIYNLKRHLKKFHNTRLPMSTRTDIKCLDCRNLQVYSIDKLREHLKSHHDYKMTQENLIFPSLNDFFVWKTQIEQRTKSSYVSAGTRKVYKSIMHYFKCHESGSYEAKGPSKRKKFTCYIGTACTAYMKVFQFKHEVEVLFAKEHYGHGKDERMRLKRTRVGMVADNDLEKNSASSDKEPVDAKTVSTEQKSDLAAEQKSDLAAEQKSDLAAKQKSDLAAKQKSDLAAKQKSDLAEISDGCSLHDDTDSEIIEVEKKYKCDLCQKKYLYLASRNKHMRNFHKLFTFNWRKKSNIRCLQCENAQFHCVNKLRQHLQSEHNYIMSQESHVFASMNEFFEWKMKYEKDTSSSYINARDSRNDHKSLTHFFRCCRSGVYPTKGSYQKQLKAFQIGVMCTSYMKVVEGTDKVKLLFAKEHYGHAEGIKRHWTVRDMKKKTGNMNKTIDEKNLVCSAEGLASVKQENKMDLVEFLDNYFADNAKAVSKISCEEKNLGSSAEGLASAKEDIKMDLDEFSDDYFADNDEAVSEISFRDIKNCICIICKKKFLSAISLKRHINELHNAGSSLVSRTKVKCLDCQDLKFTSIDKLREHLENVHDYKTTQENVIFPSLNEFFVWKNKIEQETKSSFVSVGTKKVYKSTMYYFKCHRSGSYESKSTATRRQLKETCKIGAVCTAYMKVFKFKNEVEVVFSKDHYGHGVDEEHIKLKHKRVGTPTKNDLKKNLASSDKEPVDVKIEIDSPKQNTDLAEVSEDCSFHENADSEIEEKNLVSNDKELANVQSGSLEQKMNLPDIPDDCSLHDDTDSEIEYREIEKKYKCDFCDKKYSQSATKRKHEREVHNSFTSNWCRNKNIKCLNCKNLYLSSVSKLREHLRNNHNYALIEESRTFVSMNDFFEWKNNYEKETNTSYVKLTGSRFAYKLIIHYFRCRKGTPVKSYYDTRKKKQIKSQSSSKVAIMCTSYMKVYEGANKVQLFFVKEHYGHNEEVTATKKNLRSQRKNTDMMQEGK